MTQPPVPQGNYVAAKRHGDLVYTSGMTPRDNGPHMHAWPILLPPIFSVRSETFFRPASYNPHMRLTTQQIEAIRADVAQVAGQAARVWLFGSRVHDHERGGDVDLLLDLDTPVAEPAELAARLSARVSRTLQGRKVDIVVKAPNLMNLPIHTVALEQGIRL